MRLPQLEQLYHVRPSMTLLRVSVSKEHEIEERVNEYLREPTANGGSPDPIYGICLYSLVKAYAFYKADIGKTPSDVVVVTDSDIDASLNDVLSPGMSMSYRVDEWKTLVRKDLRTAYVKNRTQSIAKPHLLGIIGEKYRLPSEKVSIMLTGFRDEGLLEETQSNYKIVENLLAP